MQTLHLNIRNPSTMSQQAINGGNMCKAIKMIVFAFLMCLNLFAQNNYDLKYYERKVPRLLDPVYGAKYMSGRRASSLIFRSLYGYNKVRELVDFLADGAPTALDNSHKTYTLAIRPDMTWHDGQPITSRDVVRSFQILKHENTNYSAKPMLDRIANISADGQFGLVLTFTETVERPQYILIFPILPSHLIKSASLNESNQFTNNPVGSGPFKIDQRGETSVVLKRFDNFENANAMHSHTNILEIDLEERYDESTWVRDLMDGNVDILTTVPLTMVTQLENHQRADYLMYPNYAVEMIGFNMRDSSSLLNLKFIRLAICHGTDRQRIINGILSTRADMISGPYPFGCPYYWSMVDEYDYEYNPESARNLLEENGCRKQGNGYYSYNGTELKFVLLHLMSNEISNIASQFKRNMERVGIKIDTYPQDQSNYNSCLKQGGFDMVYITPNYNEDFDISPLYRSTSLYNYWGYRNSTVDTYLDQLASTQDQQLALAYGNEIHKEIHNDVPCLFLWTRKKFAGYNRKLEIFDPHPLDFFQTVNEWKIRE